MGETQFKMFHMKNVINIFHMKHVINGFLGYPARGPRPSYPALVAPGLQPSALKKILTSSTSSYLKSRHCVHITFNILPVV